MTNREKFADKIIDVVFENGLVAVNKDDNIVPCADITCDECIFNNKNGYSCNRNLKVWFEEEYVEKQKISKNDKDFLNYITSFNYISRDENEKLYAYENEPFKQNTGWGSNCGKWLRIDFMNISFPMIKWEDNKPWAIDDLKNLKVVSKYEIN